MGRVAKEECLMSSNVQTRKRVRKNAPERAKIVELRVVPTGGTVLKRTL